MTAGFTPLTVTITRKPQLMESHVPMLILIDGYRAGPLKNGESSTYRLPVGAASIQAVLGMSKSPAIRISNASAAPVALEVESRISNFVFITGAALVVVSSFLVLYTAQLIYTLIALPPVLYHLYYRFIVKDSYLIIREKGPGDTRLQPTHQLPMR